MPKMSHATAKPRDTKYVLKRLWNYLYQYKWWLALAIVLTLCANSFELLGPKLSGKAIDAIGKTAGNVDFACVFYYARLMIAFYVISSIFNYLLNVLMIHITQKVVYQMRNDVFEKLQRLPVSFFDVHPLGDIISRIQYDIDTVNTSLSSDVIQIVTSTITIIFAFSMMVSISPILVLVFVFTIPLSLFITKYMTGKTRPLFRKRSKSIGDLNGFSEEMISAGKTIQAYAREEEIVKHFDVVNNVCVDSYYNADYYGSMVGPCVNFVNNLSLTLISVFGAILYLYERISLGDISSFVLYSRKFSGPINEAANIIAELQSAMAAAERVFKLLDETEEPQDAEDAYELTEVKGNVDIDHISFGYEEDKIILHDVSLHATSGQTIAIVGPTGAGKTTLINLLMRFYDINSGTIRIDGHDIMHVTRKSLRKAFAMVLQETWLFEGTIFENIAYGSENVTLEDVKRVAKAAHIDTFIERMPQGYQTIINENGTNISKGQKQLITIARAMLMNSEMLILDEATSNVDTNTEKLIQSAMLELMNGKTCFVIAHRLSTIQNADCILVVRDGNIVEQGTHEELLQKNGFYASLYNSQYE